MKKVMAVNCGSSSLKFKLFDMPEETVICSGIIERIGHDDAIFTLKHESKKETKIVPVKDHAVGVKLVLDSLLSENIIKSYDEIKATGHRVVQGGSFYKDSVLFDDDVVKNIEALIPLAPLHNGPNLTGYKAFLEVLPKTPNIAVFDTAFHQTMEKEDYTYAIPKEYTEKYMIRKYGAHGTSHKYLSLVAKEHYLKDIKDEKIIICHLGSGASISAVKNGKCVTTSMGLTPLGGIAMNTRCGDLDPSVYYQILKMSGKTNEELFSDLNKKGGLYGVSGVSNDTRDIESAANNGNEDAKLALEIWGRRVADFIGQYFVRLGGCDLLVFSAGIGENSAECRELVLNKCKEALGIEIDNQKNKETRGGKEGIISTLESKIKVAVIPTDEEVMIARDAYNLGCK